MFKFENIANVGDRIRAHDFFQRTDCYVEGIVTAKDTDGKLHPEGAACFVITVDVDCYCGVNETGRIGTTVYVPMQVAWTDWDDRVMILPNV
jgi:hypothetical protein